jgi:hypothetical protein
MTLYEEFEKEMHVSHFRMPPTKYVKWLEDKVFEYKSWRESACKYSDKLIELFENKNAENEYYYLDCIDRAIIYLLDKSNEDKYGLGVMLEQFSKKARKLLENNNE